MQPLDQSFTENTAPSYFTNVIEWNRNQTLVRIFLAFIKLQMKLKRVKSAQQ